MRKCWENIRENWLKNKKGIVKGCQCLAIDINENNHRLIHYEKEILKLDINGIVINPLEIKLSLSDKNYIRSALGLTPKQWKQLKIKDNDKTILTPEYLNNDEFNYLKKSK